MDPTQLLQHSLVYGGVLSLLLSIVVMGSNYWNAEMWLGDYPADIQEQFGPMSEKAKRQRTPVGMLFFAIIVGTLVFSILGLLELSGGTLSFLDVFISTFVVVSVFNIVDLLIIDWLILVIIRPDFSVLPGTEGAAGYSDYGFHFRGFLVGIVFSLVASLITAGITVWLV